LQMSCTVGLHLAMQRNKSNSCSLLGNQTVSYDPLNMSITSQAPIQ